MRRGPALYVYVAEAQSGLIKIGVSTNPQRRIEAIHLHSPVPCRLIALWLGSGVDEQALHHRFIEFRSHAEWFRICGSVADFVAKIRGRGVGAIPDWSEIVWNSPEAEEKRSRARARQADAMRRKWADPEWRAQQIRIYQCQPSSEQPVA